MLTIIITSILALLGILFFVFYYQHLKNKRSYSARIEADGGSIILSKLVLEFGYWLITPLARLLLKLHISPNQVTLFSLFLSLPAAYFFYQGQITIAGAIVAFSAIFDGIDGMLARLMHKQSRQGAALDSIVDRFNEMFVYMGIILFYQDCHLGLTISVTALMGSLLVSYISAQGVIYRVKLPRGLMRRGERAFYLSLAAILSSYCNQLFNFPQSPQHIMLLTALALIGLLSILSSVHRFFVLFQTLKHQNSAGQ